MKRSRDKPPSPVPNHHDPIRSGKRLDSGRLAQLIARHDSAIRQRDELLELKRSYESSHEQATVNPTTVDSIEQWHHHTATNAELSNLAGQTLPDLEAKISDLESRASLSVQTMITEGLPDNVWVGIGAGEYVLLDHRSGSPVLRRAPLDAIQCAPDGTPPQIIEDRAAQITRSRYRPIIAVSFAAAKLLSMVLGLWAVIAFLEDLATAQASLHVPLLALASLVLYLGSAFKKDLTPPPMETLLPLQPQPEPPPQTHSETGSQTDDSDLDANVPHQEDKAPTTNSDNSPRMRWS